MASFPRLKTKAVMQYPATRSLRLQNQAVRFVDGTEQRYRDSPAVLRQWAIRLSQLDALEMATVERFFEEEQGAMESFAFTDPWDGTDHPDCRLASDLIEMISAGELNGATELLVIENRR